MRMRKKNNLVQRLDCCRDYLICKTFYRSAAPKQGFHEIFEPSLPVWLEIGCGKGGFVNQAAKLHKNVNFLAVEKSENVVISAMERSLRENIPNVRYIIGLAEYLERFVPPRSIERIYLNFSCPYPKKRYEKYRLTHRDYLEIYMRILKENGEIRFKTDNSDFFDYSLESLKSNNFLIKNVTRDLHNEGFAGNIITEYEDFFIRKGYKIKYLEATPLQEEKNNI